jgi:exopolysaccharide production protein ExoZ
LPAARPPPGDNPPGSPRSSVSLPIHPYAALLALFAGGMWVVWVCGQNANPVTGTAINTSLCFAIPVLGVYVSCPDHRLGRLGELLGSASYSIYLFHLHLVSALLGVWAALHRDTPGWLVIVAVVGLVIATGAAIHLLVEKPFLRWARPRHVARPPDFKLAAP